MENVKIIQLPDILQCSWGHRHCPGLFCSILNPVVRPQFPNSWNSKFKTFFHLWI